MIKAVLFDLDGTIADTNSLIFESFRHTFRTHSIQGVSDQEIYSFFGEPLIQSMRRYAPDQAEELVETYRQYNQMVHDDMIRHFPGVREMLTELQDMGLALAIVTSKRSEAALRSLNALELKRHFEVVVTPEATLLHKPNPEPVLHGVKLLGVEPRQAIMVGDSPYDLLAGRSAGTWTCGVEYTRLNLEILRQAKPDFMIAAAQDLIPIINQLNQEETNR
ncbi:Pyrophosphatase PpaX [anaerobic digester metagenome]|nr:pyrophosphatase PpaX [Clostridiaceae bacterium HFYG-1003]